MLNLGKADPFIPSRLQSDTVAVLKMVANTEQHFTAPANSTIAVFSATDNFYVLTNGQTAAVPAGSSTSFPNPNTVPELNPTILAVTGGTTVVSVIAPATPIITISFYRGHDP